MVSLGSEMWIKGEVEEREAISVGLELRLSEGGVIRKGHGPG